MDLNDESSARSMEELSTLTEQTIENLRRLTRDLRPIYLEDLGLVTALEMLARETGQATGIQVRFQKTGTERRLAPAIELALYRISQEALNNVARHAQASTVSLIFSFTPDETKMEISDDGKGFAVPKSPAEFAPGGHFGLLGLHERAELIGAVLKIDSAPGQGTRLAVTLPTKT
jgi:signal transduction histidine kinase